MSSFRHRTRKFSALELLAALVLLFVVSPFVHGMPNGDVIEAILVTGVLFSGVFAVSVERRARTIALLLAIPPIVGKWAHHFNKEWIPEWLVFTVGMVFILFVITHLLKFVANAGVVNREVLCASISGYLLIGLFWTFAYSMLSQLSPGAFAFNVTPPATRIMDGSDAFYLSFVTLTTVGYGDITPVSPVARMLTVMEAMVGMFYVAILVSRLVALYTTEDPPRSSRE